MSVGKWSEALTCKFVKEYRKQECLWNFKTEIYKNRDERNLAYEQILQAIDMPELDVYDVKTKIKNLRSTYNQEARKIKTSIESGAEPVYRPTIKWFKDMNYVMETPTKSSENNTTLSEESEGKDESEDAYMNEIRIVNINAGDECEDETPSVSAKAPIRIQKRKPNDTKGFRDKLLRHDGQDEFDIFGQHVSHELRKLRGNRYVLAQTKRRIYQALIDADLMSLYPTAPSAKARFNQHDHVNGNDDEEN